MKSNKKKKKKVIEFYVIILITPCIHQSHVVDYMGAMFLRSLWEKLSKIDEVESYFPEISV